MAEKRLTGIARELRSNPTDAERRLWAHLRGRQMGVQFTRQFQIGDFVVDFACRRLKLAIELDGGQHTESTTDGPRTKVIEAHGYRVIRFWNNDALGNTEGVLQTITDEIALARNEV
jgi:BirA family biotin operon repressor/biotin-[acetyl-CoA-carboxylase] ligase